MRRDARFSHKAGMAAGLRTGRNQVMRIVALRAGKTRVDLISQAHRVAKSLCVAMTFITQLGRIQHRFIKSAGSVIPGQLGVCFFSIFDTVAYLALDAVPIGFGYQWIPCSYTYRAVGRKFTRDAVGGRVDPGIGIPFQRGMALSAVGVGPLPQVIDCPMRAGLPGDPDGRLEVHQARGGCGRDWR